MLPYTPLAPDPVSVTMPSRVIRSSSGARELQLGGQDETSESTDVSGYMRGDPHRLRSRNMVGIPC
jgi:hypothetical protein